MTRSIKSLHRLKEKPIYEKLVTQKHEVHSKFKNKDCQNKQTNKQESERMNYILAVDASASFSAPTLCAACTCACHTYYLLVLLMIFPALLLACSLLIPKFMVLLFTAIVYQSSVAKWRYVIELDLHWALCIYTGDRWWVLIVWLWGFAWQQRV